MPVLDFSEKWTYTATHYPLLRDMNEGLKNLFLNSVFSIMSKNKVIWGVNKANKEAYDYYENNNKIDLLNGILPGLNYYFFHCSKNFYVLTGYEQKEIIFDYIIDNYEQLKNGFRSKYSIQAIN